MRLLIFLAFLLLQSTLSAAIHQVGANKPHTTPNALYLANVVQDGDTIEIDAALYSANAALAVWQKHNLLIRGVGSSRVHLEVDGQYIWGKGIWVLAGNNIRVENIEFSGARVPDKNGAGIRLDGVGMQVRNCYFHHNEMGILTSNPGAGEIRIEHSEFGYNGYGDGYSHNVYVGRVAKLIFQYNYTHHSKIGHTLKSRANENIVLYNRLMDELDGESSRLIDLPNGGLAIVMGNLLMQGPLAENNNMLGYGKEGLSNAGPHEIYVVNNTFVNKRATCLFIDLNAGTALARAANNIFTGGGTVVAGAPMMSVNNLLVPAIADVLFADEAQYDYRLLAGSPAIDFGFAQGPAQGYALTPEAMYQHPLQFIQRSIINGAIDAGAYEFGTVATNQAYTQTLRVYPNPASNILVLELEKPQFSRIFSSDGRLLAQHGAAQTLDLEGLKPGLYHLVALDAAGVLHRCNFVVH